MLKKLKKFLHWESSPKPEYHLSPQIYGELKPFRWPIILVIFVFMFGTLGYIAIDNVDIFLAFYETGITFTTVGYGEVYPMSNDARLFSVFLIIVGYLVFALSIGVLIEIIRNGRLVKLLKERRMLYKIARLKKHYVICYHSQFTIEITNEFRKAHIPFVVVSPEENLEKIAKKYNYPFYLQEEPHTDVAMKKAHLSSAKGVITLSQNNADNIALISSVRLFEKELKRKPYFIVSIAERDEDIEKLKKLGANEVLNPNKLMAQRATAIAKDTKIKNLLEEFLYSEESIVLEELKVPKQSWIVSRQLKETHLRELTNVSIVGIKDVHSKFTPMPKDDKIINKGDILYLIGTKDSIKKARMLLKAQKKPKEAEYV